MGEGQNYPSHLEDGIKCFYARDYISGNGFQGEANQLILNFKKPLNVKGTNQWGHRDRSVKQFATELSTVLKSPNIHVVPIPGSKPWNHPENNRRFQDLCTELLKLKNNVTVQWAIDCLNPVVASSQGGPRTPAEIKANYQWNGLRGNISKLVLLDDVITSGAHFKACYDFIRENGYQGEIAGVFWAKTKFKNPFDDFNER